jgi:SlyX protein
MTAVVEGVRMTSNDEQLVEMQSQLAFQEDTLQALNEIVIRQQQQIGALEQELTLHREKLAALVESLSERVTPVGASDERPPHY